jgi:hypothetical protein
MMIGIKMRIFILLSYFIGAFVVVVLSVEDGIFISVQLLENKDNILKIS